MRAFGVSDRAGSGCISRYRYIRSRLPLCYHDVGSLNFTLISRLNTRPARTPVNASLRSLQTTAHDLGPMWLARPSSYDSFIHDTPPVFIGAR